MKVGKTLRELTDEIERQQNAKKDLIVSTKLIEPVLDVKNLPALRIGAEGTFGINETAHNQIAQHTGIPAKYYDRMREEAPELWGRNVREWFNRFPANRLVRTLDGVDRAFLSDSYKPLDNFDFAEAVLPAIQELKGVRIMSAEITERRLYIKVVDEALERDLPKGRKLGDGSHVFYDTVCPAAILSNSEVGYGTLSIESGIFTRQCTNLASIRGAGWKKRHLGARNLLGSEDEIRHLLSDDTRKATDNAMWLQVRDVLRGAFEEAKFDATVNKLKGLTEQKLEGDTIKVVEKVAKKFSFTIDEQGSVLKNLVEGADLSRYGLLNAITRAAQDAKSYDRASELEQIGGDVADIVEAEWRELQAA